MPLMFAAMFVFLPCGWMLLGSNVVRQSAALIIIYTIAVLPFCVWQLHHSLDRVPPEIENALRMDGCSGGEFFRHFLLPTIAPSLFVTTLFSLIAAWSLCVIMPLILQSSGTAILAGQPKMLSAAAFSIATAPLALCFLFLSVYLVRSVRTRTHVDNS